jgi:hypothetical protein
MSSDFYSSKIKGGKFQGMKKLKSSRFILKSSRFILINFQKSEKILNLSLICVINSSFKIFFVNFFKSSFFKKSHK